MSETISDSHTLHVLIHPQRLSLLKLALAPADRVVLGGAALSVDISLLSGHAVYGLERDSTDWGIPLQDSLQTVSDTQWVELSAEASRVIVW